MKPFLAILALCTAAAILYGLIHDQITARVCIEYFTIGHPRILRSDSPTLHALYWGVAATWWVGLISDVLIAAAARAGSWPTLSARNIWPLVLALVIVMALAAWAAGTFGRSFAKTYPPSIHSKRGGAKSPRTATPTSWRARTPMARVIKLVLLARWSSRASSWCDDGGG